MIIIPSNVASAPSDPNWSNTTLMLKTIATPGATNSAFYDDGPNKFVPTRNGDVTQGALSPYIPSGYWSAYFDGTGDYLTIPDNAALRMGTGDFCVEFWWFPVVLNGFFVTPFCKGYTASGALLFQSDGNDKIVTYLDGTAAITSTVAVTRGAWNHIALTRSGTTLRLFVNGAAAGTTTNSSNLSSTSQIILGANNAGTASLAQYPITGHLSNCRVVKGSPVYTAAFTPPTAPLTAITNTSLLALQDNRFIDRSANNFTITKVGDTAVSRFAPFGVQVPVTTNLASTGSVAFDGTGDYLVPGSASSAFAFPSDFTIEFWMNPTTIAGASRIAYDGRGISTQGAYPTIAVESNGTLIYYANSAVQITTSASAVSTGRWYHVAICRSGTSTRMFLNGALIGTYTGDTTSYLNSAANRPRIGANGNSDDGNNFVGQLSNVRVLKGVAAYTTAFTPPTSPLTAITGTSLLTCQDAVTVTDASTNNNFTVTRVGNAAASEVSPFKRATAQYGGSGYFDGAGDRLTMPSATEINPSSGNFTFECWINPANWTATYAALWVAYVNTGLWIGKNGGNFVVRSAFVSDLLATSTFPTVGAWTHLAIARSGSTLSMFYNGTRVATATNSTTFIQGQVWIGDDGEGGAFYAGSISNLRLVKGTAVYDPTQTSFTPPTAPVTAISGTSLLLNFDNAGAWDATGNLNYQTRGTASTSNTLVRYADTSLNQAVKNDGSSTAVVGPALSTSALPGDFTIELWYSPTSGFQDSVIYDHGPSSGTLAFITTAGGAMMLFINSALGTTGSTVLQAGSWYHLTICRSGTSTRMFINGVQEGATVSNSTSFAATNPRLGSYANGTYNTPGYYSDLRVTRAARYTANFTAPTAAFPTQ